MERSGKISTSRVMGSWHNTWDAMLYSLGVTKMDGGILP